MTRRNYDYVAELDKIMEKLKFSFIAKKEYKKELGISIILFTDKGFEEVPALSGDVRKMMEIFKQRVGKRIIQAVGIVGVSDITDTNSGLILNEIPKKHLTINFKADNGMKMLVASEIINNMGVVSFGRTKSLDLRIGNVEGDVDWLDRLVPKRN